MKEGYKNREVASRRDDYSMYMLSSFSQRQIATTGMLEQEYVEYQTERSQRERFVETHTTNRVIMEILNTDEYYSKSYSFDGVPVNHYIDYELGLISVINFGDTFLAYCKDEGLTQRLLRRLLSEGRDAEMVTEYIRVFLGKQIPIREIYNRVRRLDKGNLHAEQGLNLPWSRL